MSLSYRARVIAAAQDRIPSRGTLRFVPPDRYLPVLRKTREAYSPQAATDGLNSVNVLRNKRLATSLVASETVRPPIETSPQLPDRAAGVLEDIDTSMGHVNPARRFAVSRRNVATFRFQKRYLGALKG